MPITGLRPDVVAEVAEELYATRGGIGPEGRTESFVGVLMAIHKLQNQCIFGFTWREFGTTIVAECKEDCAPGLCAPTHQILEPRSGDKVQECCGGDQVEVPEVDGFEMTGKIDTNPFDAALEGRALQSQA